MKSIKKKIVKPIKEELKDTKRDIVQTGKLLIRGSNDYPPNVKQLINQYGNEVIQSISLKRSPVEKLLTGALSIFSLGKFGERFKKSFDELFHLFMEMTTTNGTKLLLEKNERINMELNPRDRPNTEIKQVLNVPHGITINQLLQNTKNRMGSQFFQYDAVQNNCQDFLLNVFQANGIGDRSDVEFIKQDTEKLFKGLPVLKKFAHLATELGERGNIVMSGGSIFKDEKFVETIRKLRNNAK